MNFSELSLNHDEEYESIFRQDEVDEVFDPFDDRHAPSWSTRALSDIFPSQEIFDNYLTYGGNKFWKENLRELKSLCLGLIELGPVSQYELENTKTE